jgi:small-conductance mechanosensitive channel
MEEIGLDIATLLTPLFVVLTSLIVTLMIKDIATGIAKGLQFKWYGGFKEGDKVIVDNQQGLVVKIGARQTVFGIHYDDGSYHWRLVSNDRIASLKLEKVIIDATPRVNGSQIQKNAEAIEKLKN